MGSDHSHDKPNVIFILGGPGSGKGTQCKKILQNNPNTKFVHLSTGSLLREAMQEESEENKQILQLMKQGKMVPSKPLVQLIRKKIESLGNQPYYILDGFPRNSQNLKAWKQVIGEDFSVRFMLYFDCQEDELRKRLLNRAKTSARADDNPETIQKRIKTFYSETTPMLQIYKEGGHRIIHINSIQTIDDVAKDTNKALKNEKII